MAEKVSKELSDIRAKNLQDIVDVKFRGVVLTLAKKAGMPSTNLHRILGRHMNMGNKLAKKLEITLGMSVGEFDKPLNLSKLPEELENKNSTYADLARQALENGLRSGLFTDQALIDFAAQVASSAAKKKMIARVIIE